MAELDLTGAMKGHYQLVLDWEQGARPPQRTHLLPAMTGVLAPALVLGLVGSAHCIGMCGPWHWRSPPQGAVGRDAWPADFF